MKAIIRKSLERTKDLLKDPNNWSQMTIHANEHGEVITRRENPDGINLYEAIYDGVMMITPLNHPNPGEVLDKAVTVVAAEIGRRHKWYRNCIEEGHEVHAVVEYNNLDSTCHLRILSILASCIRDLRPQEDPHPWDSHRNA